MSAFGMHKFFFYIFIYLYICFFFERVVNGFNAFTPRWKHRRSTSAWGGSNDSCCYSAGRLINFFRGNGFEYFHYFVLCGTLIFLFKDGKKHVHLWFFKKTFKKTQRKSKKTFFCGKMFLCFYSMFFSKNQCFSAIFWRIPIRSQIINEPAILTDPGSTLNENNSRIIPLHI